MVLAIGAAGDAQDQAGDPPFADLPADSSGKGTLCVGSTAAGDSLAVAESIGDRIQLSGALLESVTVDESGNVLVSYTGAAPGTLPTQTLPSDIASTYDLQACGDDAVTGDPPGSSLAAQIGGLALIATGGVFGVLAATDSPPFDDGDEGIPTGVAATPTATPTRSPTPTPTERVLTPME